MSVLADIRTDVHDALVSAVDSDTIVYEYMPDDIQDPPCVMIGYLTVQRSFTTPGQSIVRASVFCVPYRGATKDTIRNMDDLTATVWNSLGGGSSLLLPTSKAMSQPQAASPENLSVGENEWPAIRVDSDITIPSAFC